MQEEDEEEEEFFVCVFFLGRRLRIWRRGFDDRIWPVFCCCHGIVVGIEGERQTGREREGDFDGFDFV